MRIGSGAAALVLVFAAGILSADEPPPPEAPRDRESHAGLWPLFQLSSGDEYHQMSVLWPLVNSYRNKNYRHFGLWPFFARTAADDYTCWEFLSPLPTWPRWIPNPSLLRYSVAGARKNFRIFPLLFYSRDSDNDITNVHFLPPLGQYYREEERTSFRLLPLFWYDKRPDEFDFSFLWPLSRVRSTPDVTEFRLLPLFGYYRNPEADETLLTLLNLYYHRERRATDAAGAPVYYRHFCVFPLFDYRRRDDSWWRVSLLRWLVTVERSRKTSRFSVLPYLLFDYFRDRGTGDVDVRALGYYGFRLAISRERFHLHLLPLFWADLNADGTGTIFTLAPPFYAHCGPKETVSWLFPLFVYVRKGEDYNLLAFPFGYEKAGSRWWFHFRYPLGSVSKGPNSFYFQLFPHLYQFGWTRHYSYLNAFPVFSCSGRDVDYRHFVLFPLYWHYRTPSRLTHILLPVFGFDRSSDGSAYRLYFAPPLAWISVNRKTHYFALRLLASLFYYIEGERRTFRMAGREIAAGPVSFGAIPLLLFVNASPQETSVDFVSPLFHYDRYTDALGRDETTFWFAGPLLYHHSSHKGTLTHSFWYLLRYEDDRVAKRREFCGLFYLFRYAEDDVASTREFNFLYRWGWYHSSPEGVSAQFIPLFRYDASASGDWTFDLLGGVVGFGERRGRARLKFLFIPFGL